MRKKSTYFKSHPYCLYQSTFNSPFPLPTNSLGLIGKKEYSLKRNPNFFRILVLGSSPVERLPPAEENKKNNPNLTFTHFLEKELNNIQKIRKAKKKFEVLNLSSSGYTSYECLISYICRGRYFNPDLVISYQGINDILWAVIADNFEKDYSHARENNFKNNECWINNLMCNLPDSKFLNYLDRILVKLKVKKPNGLIYSISKPNLKIDPKFDKKKLNPFIDNINTLNKVCYSNNTNFLNLSFVWDQSRPARPSHVYNQLKKKKFKNLFDKYYNKYLNEINRLLFEEKELEVIKMPKKDFTPDCFSDGIHFNVKGMEKISSITAKYIIENEKIIS